MSSIRLADGCGWERVGRLRWARIDQADLTSLVLGVVRLLHREVKSA